MKILIVDDETLTREGIITNINWQQFGITDIYEADDGIHGIEQAKQYQPNIILSDIRMPRMNGIEMVLEIQKILPDVSIIFMSGYSDKEYLKAAIKLKAISYVEKPIDATEIEASIKSALAMQLLLVKNQITSNSHNKYTENKLALQLIYYSQDTNDKYYLNQFEELNYAVKPTTEFTTLIITLKKEIPAILDKDINYLNQLLKDLTKKHRLHYISAVKNDEYLILHLFTDSKNSGTQVNQICHSLSSNLAATYEHYIIVGKTVRGPRNAHESYNTAVLLLQSAYFYEYNSIIRTYSATTAPVGSDQPLLIKYTEALNQQDKEHLLETAAALFHLFKNNQRVLPNYVKNLYYKLFTLLIQKASDLHITAFHDDASATVLDYVSKDSNYIELHQLLLDKISLFFSSQEEHLEDNATIYLIKEFINQNYRNDTLSVKDISQHVFLSSSYVCTLFKNETGKTLNQYLTEFRIEKAKNMLLDPRYKITDISAKVGYSDANYFGKTFKKLVDLSPSEYRERYGK